MGAGPGALVFSTPGRPGHEDSIAKVGKELPSPPFTVTRPEHASSSAALAPWERPRPGVAARSLGGGGPWVELGTCPNLLLTKWTLSHNLYWVWLATQCRGHRAGTGGVPERGWEGGAVEQGNLLQAHREGEVTGGSATTSVGWKGGLPLGGTQQARPARRGLSALLQV